MPDYAMTVMLPKKRYGDIVVLDYKDAREAVYRMLHDIPPGAKTGMIKFQILAEQDEDY